MTKQLAAGFALLLAFLALLPASPSHAEATGIVLGTVVNGTPGAAMPSGLEIRLQRFRSDLPDGEPMTTQSDSSAQFFFVGLETSSEYTYEITTVYQNIEYTLATFQFAAGETTKNLQGTVYESTSDNGKLSIGLGAIIVGNPEPDSRTVQMFEIATLLNTGDRTFVPDLSSPGGPMASLVRFGLPAGARSLSLAPGIDPSSVAQVDRGFALMAPVPPGSQEIAFTYNVPYQGSELQFSRGVVFTTEAMRLVVPKSLDFTPGRAGWSSSDLSLGGQPYTMWEAHNLKPGDRVEFTLQGLPKRFPWDGILLPEVPQSLIAGIGAAMALLVTAGYALVRGRPKEASPAPPSQPSLDSPQAVAALQRIADLDDEYLAGGLEQAEYERRRTQEKAELLEWLADASANTQAPGSSR